MWPFRCLSLVPLSTPNLDYAIVFFHWHHIPIKIKTSPTIHPIHQPFSKVYLSNTCMVHTKWSDVNIQVLDDTRLLARSPSPVNLPSGHPQTDNLPSVRLCENRLVTPKLPWELHCLWSFMITIDHDLTYPLVICYSLRTWTWPHGPFSSLIYLLIYPT